MQYPTTEQSELVNYLNANCKSISKTSSRHLKHFRVEATEKVLQNALTNCNAIVEFKEQNDDNVISCSGTPGIATKILVLKNDIIYKKGNSKNNSKIKAGTWCYFVNRFNPTAKNAKTLEKKDLTPNKLGLEISQYKGNNALHNFDRDVYSGISKQKISPAIKWFIKQIYYLVATTRKRPSVNKIKSSSGAYEKLSLTINYPNTQNFKDVMVEISNDLNLIGQNFGEVLALRWALSRSKYYNFYSFGYPTASNEALIDCFVYTKEEIYSHGNNKKNDISVKYAGGAAPSIVSMLPSLKIALNEFLQKDKAKLKPETIKKADALKYFDSDNSTAPYPGTNSDKVLKALEVINSKDIPVYGILENLFKKEKINISQTIKISDINVLTASLINSYSKNNNIKLDNEKNRAIAFKESFSDILSVTGSLPSDSTINKILVGNESKYFNLICFSMTTYLKNKLKEDEDLQKILSLAVSKNQIDQIYVNFTSNGIHFESKEFSDNIFQFDYNGMGSNAGNSNIKFSMIK